MTQLSTVLTISIIMPVYNAGEYLAEAVNSIEANDCEGVSIEVIMVDDASTDPHTQALLKNYASRPGYKIIYLPINGGPSRARNAGIKAATGDWVGFLDADDLFTPSSIERRRDAIRALPDVRWIASDILEMRTRGESRHYSIFKEAYRQGREAIPGVSLIAQPTRQMVAWQMLPPLGAMMVRRDLLHSIGMFGEDLKYGEDIHFCLMASTYADLYWITEAGLILRRHHVSMTHDLLRMACEAPRYTLKLLREERLRSVRKQLRWQHAAALRHMSKLSLLHNCRWQAFYSALLAIFWTPNNLRSFQLAFNAILPRQLRKV